MQNPPQIYEIHRVIASLAHLADRSVAGSAFCPPIRRSQLVLSEFDAYAACALFGGKKASDTRREHTHERSIQTSGWCRE